MCKNQKGVTKLVFVTAEVTPALIVASGDRAQTRFWEFFISNIRNPHTRRAYGRAVHQRLACYGARGTMWPRARK
jgi:hypothetical protein